MIKDNLTSVLNSIGNNVTLVAVSKTKPNEDLLEAYACGQCDFGENYVQELVDKYQTLPKDIRWHMIGHLQSNKVKYIAPFVHLIHGVDSLKLLTEINKQGLKNNRVISCLLQVHIAVEETKFGFDAEEIRSIVDNAPWKDLSNIQVKGLMTMGSNTEDENQIVREFKEVATLFNDLKTKPNLPSNVKMEILSMGMSHDYLLAINQGSTMVRVGSLIFGQRNYSK